MEIVHFWAEVAPCGYEWTHAPLWEPLGPSTEEATWQERYLTEREKTQEGKRYAPLAEQEYADLFCRFANLSPAKEDVRAFANQFGLLGCGVRLRRGPKWTSEGETLDSWQDEIEAMRRALTLWNHVQGADEKGLRRFIHWEKDERVIYESESKTWELEGFDFRPGDLLQPALMFIRLEVNKHIAPSFIRSPEQGPPQCWVQPYLTLLPGNRMGMRVIPNNLLGALWWQCAQAIDGHKSFHRCDQCGKWFEVAPQVEMRHRLFCSPACRMKAYRLRQEEACQLHGQGVSLKEIAKRLETDTVTAKRWIKKKAA